MATLIMLAINPLHRKKAAIFLCNCAFLLLLISCAGRNAEKELIAACENGDLERVKEIIEREEAEIGVLIMLNPPTAPMRTEAADAGFYSPGSKDVAAKGFGATVRYPRIQILTIDELLKGGRIDYPERGGAGNVTLRRAPRAGKKKDDSAGSGRLI